MLYSGTYLDWMEWLLNIGWRGFKNLQESMLIMDVIDDDSKWAINILNRRDIIRKQEN